MKAITNKTGNSLRFSTKILAAVTVLLLVAASLLGLYTTHAYAEGADNSKIVILHTNDVHCAIGEKSSTSLKYENLAWYKKELLKTYSNVTLVDVGDNLQGASSGLFSEGKYPLEIMNAAGYEVSAIGNHDFDYGVSRLLELTKDSGKIAYFPYISCNFKYIKSDGSAGDTVYDPYYVKTYNTSKGEKKVAFVGVTTPESLTKCAGDIFKDDSGNYKYTFCEDSTGQALYDCVQDAVDDAKNNAGADYVILLAHLGQEGIVDAWRSDTVVKNTTGIDAVLDGHSHQEYQQTVNNADGEGVTVVQAGNNFSKIGELTIDVEGGEITTKLLKYADIESIGTDEATETKADEIRAELDTKLSVKIGESRVKLYAHEDDGYTWAVRLGETNMGDLITDAFRITLGADVSIINGGAIRNDINIGDVTYKDVINVQPFGNDTVVIKATGQQILDALEMGARLYPELNAAFMHVSGITYDIMKNIPSSVVLDEYKNFVRVDGEYRVQNVKINGEPIDLTKEYTVGGITFTLLRQGDGLTMFDNCEVVKYAPLDYEVMATYIKETLGGVIGTEYADKYGQGRIIITDKKAKASDVNTGDDSDMELYLALFVIAAAAGGFIKRKAA